MDSLLELFVNVDDFCQVFLPQLEQQMLTSGAIKRRRTRSLSVIVHSLKLKRLSRIMVQKWGAGYKFHAFCASKWEEFFMSEIIVAKRLKHLHRRPPHVAYSSGFSPHIAIEKLNLTNKISANGELLVK